MGIKLITIASFCAFTFYFSASRAEGHGAETRHPKNIELPTEETKCTFSSSIEGQAIEPFELTATDVGENQQERVFFDYKVSLSYYPARGGCCAYPPQFILWIGTRDESPNDSGDYETAFEIQWPNGNYELASKNIKGTLHVKCTRTDLSSAW
jgi:hypothetical protein